MIPLCPPKQARVPTALALGSFDGLHAGHRRVINEIVKDGKGIPTVVSFWPHPREVLYGEQRLRLDLPSEKTELLGPLGVEQLVLVPFDHSLAALSPEEFVDQILVQTLKAKKIAVGANFRFGKNRQGDAQRLKELASHANIDIVILPIIEDSQGRISSSRIRNALNEGDLESAKKFMGRPFKFRGQVVEGKGIGRKIGWPTANLQVDGRKFLPGIGVYAAWAFLNESKTPLPAVMNLGPQPTVDPNSPSCVEVHLLNQQLDLRGKGLIVQPIKRLRSQKRFEGLNALSKQISNDAKMAELILQSTKV